MNQTEKIEIALVGNPNCGKTTLFNQLTGSNQYVGNWPGVTVEKKMGKIKNCERNIEVIDLPGIYSLSPYSQEEIVSRNCLIDDEPDVILNIIDATNIERNLYLTTQLLELDCPVIVAVNMMDLLKKRGNKLNCKELQKRLNTKVIPISASKGMGIEKLLTYIETVSKTVQDKKAPRIYKDDVEKLLSDIDELVHKKTHGKKFSHDRFYSVRIFEGDESIIKRFRFDENELRKISQIQEMVKNDYSFDNQMIIADQRYLYICEVCGASVIKKNKEPRLTLSDKIDKIVTNKYLAIPIFLSVLLAIFIITFGPFGNMLRDSVQNFINQNIGYTLSNLLINLGASEWTRSLVVKGMVAGVGAVISFLPQVSILFVLLSMLEDSGYMARGAFIMDHLLRKIGLSGKAFVPLLMGFGCTVPAVLGTRTLENDRDRRLAIMITPFMSCSAKMPVYALFISTFFQRHQPLVILSIYLLGIIVAVLSAVLFKGTILKGETPSFIMEMPPYHMPTPKNLFLHVWDRIKDFITKAGTVILAATIVIWFLQSFDTNFKMASDSSHSILARIGTAIAPIFTICGFGDWKSSVSLLTGIVAKESVVSTMAILNGGNLSLQTSITSSFTPLSAYSFMVFVLLYTPCVAALSAIAKELKSFKLTAITIFYQLIVAWTLSAMIFQFGSLFSRIDLIIIILAVIVVFVTAVKIFKSIKLGKCTSCSGKCIGCKSNERKCLLNDDEANRCDGRLS